MKTLRKIVAPPILAIFALSAYTPASSGQDLADLSIQPSSLHSPWREVRDRAINPDDYECGETELGAWLGPKIPPIGNGPGEIPLAAVLFLSQYAVWDWPLFYTMFIDHNASDDYIGLFGEHTSELTKRHKDNRRFWDVDTQAVQLHGMHGAVIGEDELMVPLLRGIIWDQVGILLPDEILIALVDQAQLIVETYFGYDHPIFTFNAVAFGGAPPNPPLWEQPLPPKVIMGEGLLLAYDDLGLGDVAPDFIHAHEYAHQLQFVTGEIGANPPSPEETRRTELMADAFAAYYSGHARGATFQTKRFVQVMAAAYEVGDCVFDSFNHHGTPNQREAAAVWGGDTASATAGTGKGKKRGKIMSTEDLIDAFHAYLPVLLLPDAD